MRKSEPNRTDRRTASRHGAGFTLTAPNTILVLGSDARTKNLHEPGSVVGAPGRSDSIMLIRAGGGKSARLSIPRDTVVDIPGHGRGKINAAYGTGGAALAIRTVERLTGIGVNHVATVDFNAFAQVIDELGGVTIDVPRRIVSNRFDCPYPSNAACSRWDGWKFARGEHTMDGERALIYARIRENRLDVNETDITRILPNQTPFAGAFFDVPNSRSTNPGLFFQGTEFLSDRTRVTYGGRWDHVSTDSDFLRPGSNVAAGTAGSPLRYADHGVYPYFRAQYMIGSKFDIPGEPNYVPSGWTDNIHNHQLELR